MFRYLFRWNLIKWFFYFFCKIRFLFFKSLFNPFLNYFIYFFDWFDLGLCFLWNAVWNRFFFCNGGSLVYLFYLYRIYLIINPTLVLILIFLHLGLATITIFNIERHIWTLLNFFIKNSLNLTLILWNWFIPLFFGTFLFYLDKHFFIFMW